MYNRPDPRASWLQTPGDSPGRGQSHGEIMLFFSWKWWNRLSDDLKHNQIFESALCCTRIGEMIISRNPNVGMTSTVGNGNFAPNGRIDRPQVKACAASTWSFCSCFTCRLRGDWPRWQNFGGGNVTRAWFRTSKKIKKKYCHAPTAIKDTLIFSLLSSFRSSSFSSSSCLWWHWNKRCAVGVTRNGCVFVGLFIYFGNLYFLGLGV